MSDFGKLLTTSICSGVSVAIVRLVASVNELPNDWCLHTFLPLIIGGIIGGGIIQMVDKPKPPDDKSPPGP